MQHIATVICSKTENIVHVITLNWWTIIMYTFFWRTLCVYIYIFHVVATLKRNKHCTKFQLSMTCPSWSGPRLMSSPLYIYIYYPVHKVPGLIFYPENRYKE